MTPDEQGMGLKARLQALEVAVRALDWKSPVPDDLQSEVRMEFNEALAGGPNMNGDGGPTLTPNHALDCVWATMRIAELTRTIPALPSSDDVVERVARAIHIARYGEREPEPMSDTDWEYCERLARAAIAAQVTKP